MEARPNALFDPAWLGRVVSEKQAELLGRYRAVLFAEVDEIVIPRQGSLRQSVAAFARETEEGGADAAATEAAAAGAAAARATATRPLIFLCSGGFVRFPNVYRSSEMRARRPCVGICYTLTTI